MLKEDYLQLRKSLKMEPQSQELIQHFSKDALLLSAIILFCQPELAWQWNFVAAPLIAILIFRSFSMMHEFVHRRMVSSHLLNEGLGIYFGALTFLPFEPWKKGHLKHHYWSGNVDKDPVMAFLRIYPGMNRGLKFLVGFGWRFWLPILSAIQISVFWCLALIETKNSKHKLKDSSNLLAPLMLWASVFAFSPTTVLWTAVLPGIFIYLLGVEVINFPHHLQLDSISGEEKLPLWLQHQSSRSCIYPTWIAHHIVLNFNLHTEHHLFPEAPWYHLPQIQTKLDAILGPSKNSDPQFAWILKNRKRPLHEAMYAKGSKRQIASTKDVAS